MVTEQICENCGNSYDKALKINYMGEFHTFDSFECAINVLAPQCAHCNTRIIGHGMEREGKMFCCAHCAQNEGAIELRDRM